MKTLSKYTQYVILLSFLYSFSQIGSLKIDLDPKLEKVIELKKEVNSETFTSGQFTIQIFNGKYNDGIRLMDSLTIEKKYDNLFFSFETPYYKIRIGKYISKIKAIRELKKIKKDFSSAFILRPNWLFNFLFDFYLWISFYYISDFNIIVVFDLNTTFISLSDFFSIVFKSL